MGFHGFILQRVPVQITMLILHALVLQGKDQGRMIEKPVTKCDSGTQTDTHFMESNIVKSYEWNEWELRRKAIKLVSG